MAKEVLERKDIAEEFKWDLESFFKDLDAWKRNLRRLARWQRTSNSIWASLSKAARAY